MVRVVFRVKVMFPMPIPRRGMGVNLSILSLKKTFPSF